MSSVCGLQPRDDGSDAAAIVVLYHNRCVSTKQHEGGRNILKRRPEAWQGLIHSSSASQTLFSCLAFTLQVQKCFLICTCKH